MPKYKFWLNGHCSSNYGLYLQSQISFTAPQPNYTKTSVPGRNGAVITWDGSYTNVTGTASCFVLRENHADDELAHVAEFLNFGTGYVRMETEYEPHIYRLAYVSQYPDCQIRLGHVAPFTLLFDCKPQKFLKTGEKSVSITTSGTKLRNPTRYPALPEITIHGSGASVFNAGGTTVRLLEGFSEHCVLDCDTQNAYYGLNNLNSILMADSYPQLEAGENNISWTGGITSVDIIPHWWTL